MIRTMWNVDETNQSQNVTFRMRKLKKGLLKAFLHQRVATITSGATQFHPRSSKKADN